MDTPESCCDSCEHVTRPFSPPEGITLRVMKAADLPHVRALHHNLLPVSYPAAFFVQLLINPRQLCLVAADRGAIIGFASAARDASQPGLGGGYAVDSSTVVITQGHADRECSESHAEIPRSHITLLTLGVMPAYQRKGIGRSLVHSVVQRLEASCATAPQPHCPVSSEHSTSRIAVLVRAQVAQSNHAGKCFYAQLGMMDQRNGDNPWLHVGPGPRTSVVAGVLCV